MKTVKNPVNVTESLIRILKAGSCSSRSGKSTLTYHIGCSAESDIHFRVYTNTGSGYFSREWLALNTILELLAKVGKSFTSFNLQPLFRGKSVNTPAFLLAVLVEEGLVKPSEKKRCYELAEPSAFMDKIKPLIDSKTSLNDDDKPVKPLKKKASSDKESSPKPEQGSPR
jgi:hypothetical protein